MSADRDLEPAVAVMCKDCPGFVMVAVSKYLDASDHTAIGEYAAKGHAIRQVTCGEARAVPWCRCTHAGATA